MTEKSPEIDEASVKLQELMSSYRAIKEIPIEELVKIGYKRDRKEIISKLGEVKEFSFEEGVDIATRYLANLYEKTDEDLIVVINGSDQHVGKTALKKSLVAALRAINIPTHSLLENFDIEEERIKLKEARNTPNHPRRSIYFGEEINLKTGSLEERYRFALRDHMIYSADFFIAIYRPDKPFKSRTPTADIIIRNDHAHDKLVP